MLELDALFRRYLDHHGQDLDERTMELMEALLSQQDQTLFEVFSGHSTLPDAAQQDLFVKIIECRDTP
jgi:succinate dehydrogenase flavin-adding protein (antitoxin of CptAB toxin-antitoxin module)